MPAEAASQPVAARPAEPAPPPEIDLEGWEEWSGEGSFFHHCIAGSIAGISEHVLMFPFDTYKTHLQFSRGRSTLTFWQLMQREGFPRLWRGAPAMVIASVPSHAAYFSAYEAGKAAFGANAPGHHPVAAAAAGALSTLLHDAVLTPMDVVKQRLQLGFYPGGVLHCLRAILAEEGLGGLYRSYPTTVLMNIPYASVVVSANESLKKLLAPADGSRPGLWTYMLSGAGAGALGAAVTCPLDVIKTRLQTDTLAGRSPPLGAGGGGSAAASASSSSGGGVGALRSVLSATLSGSGSSGGGGGVHAHASGGLGGPPLQVAQLYTSAAPRSSSSGGGGGGGVGAAPAPPPHAPPSVRLQALGIARELWREGGVGAFFKGVRARMLVHTPSMAISWSTYEVVKGLLVEHFPLPGGPLPRGAKPG